jgi:NMD protein affecting ribosome stability and mRNA decay
MVCHVCGRELSKSEAVPVYKNVLDRETGELKPVLDYYLCKSCDALVKKRSKTLALFN